ncbi:MAG: FecR domain-containing protein [Cytophagaceae bacterium]|nr:FecR domain-containing protein [Cytophagaceae bacterium]
MLASTDKPLEVSLPDGSRVTLNRKSKLTYPADFDEDIRSVSLTGEAFFDVKTNSEKPFIIQAAGAEVRVLGTSFNVDATTPNVTVNVATGRVLFSVRQHAIVLTKGQAVAFRAEADTILKVPRADPNANAYKTRLLLFEATPLSQLVEALNQLRHRRIANCALTATYEDETLDGILAVLAESLSLQVERTADGIIYLDGAGCSSP